MTVSVATIELILFDYGGVLAEEGFRNGLGELAREAGLDPEMVHDAAGDAIYASGYIAGNGSEADFWAELSRRSGLPPWQPEFTALILKRFVLRPGMLALVRELRDQGLRTAVLSDQTDWLDTLERRDRFFQLFEAVVNSYHLGKGKRDPSIFTDMAVRFNQPPATILFIDDNSGHVRRARAAGLQAVLFEDELTLRRQLAGLLG